LSRCCQVVAFHCSSSRNDPAALFGDKKIAMNSSGCM
jgi:hypothetical protein